MTDHRIKALGTVVAAHYGRIMREGNHTPDAAIEALEAIDAFHLAEVLLTQPLQVIVGNVPGAFGSYRDGFELFNRARSDKKNIFAVEGASHYALYDQPKYTAQALKKLESYFEENL
ncbi:alpha/beta hydrolase [Streptomyces sp. AS58]|uniref:alpha/beta hydrolase n=1 Tax=Streptomyces sp. AS58 TaxID=1519489 RepID=UPI00099D9AF7|nr:alpha/beta hydrolase [Streptomyces sp. AS58]